MCPSRSTTESHIQVRIGEGTLLLDDEVEDPGKQDARLARECGDVGWKHLFHCPEFVFGVLRSFDDRLDDRVELAGRVEVPDYSVDGLLLGGEGGADTPRPEDSEVVLHLGLEFAGSGMATKDLLVLAG